MKVLDLGAYTGDTIENSCFSNGKYNEIVAFEPEEDSFALLGRICNKKDLKTSNYINWGAITKKQDCF